MRARKAKKQFRVNAFRLTGTLHATLMYEGGTIKSARTRAHNELVKAGQFPQFMSIVVVEIEKVTNE